MIIVIVIISIMLSITLNMSANQTQSLRFKIARESFLANYNSFIIRAITTNSNDLRLELKIDNGAQIFAPINPV
jgi:type II secretory pathway pseudopilin PulG